MTPFRRSTLAFVAIVAILDGCSLRQVAVDSIGSSLAREGTAWASDDDPELVRGAAPFALKTIESLLAESPRNRDLLLAAARGFAQYSYAWVEQDADAIESQDLQQALALRQRARLLYRRAFDYGSRGLEVAHPGWREHPEASIPEMRAADVPLLYWTAVAWGALISLSKDDPEMMADLSLVGDVMNRALQLDEEYEGGAIHDFLIAYDGARPASAGGSIERARNHFRRAIELSGGHRAAPYVTLAETVSVATQNKAEFEELLGKALAVNVNEAPQQRLANLIYQKRARMLLARTEDFFVE